MGLTTNDLDKLILITKLSTDRILAGKLEEILIEVLLQSKFEIDNNKQLKFHGNSWNLN